MYINICIVYVYVNICVCVCVSVYMYIYVCMLVTNYYQKFKRASEGIAGADGAGAPLMARAISTVQCR